MSKFRKEAKLPTKEHFLSLPQAMRLMGVAVLCMLFISCTPSAPTFPPPDVNPDLTSRIEGLMNLNPNSTLADIAQSCYERQYVVDGGAWQKNIGTVGDYVGDSGQNKTLVIDPVIGEQMVLSERPNLHFPGDANVKSIEAPYEGGALVVLGTLGTTGRLSSKMSDLARFAHDYFSRLGAKRTVLNFNFAPSSVYSPVVLTSPEIQQEIKRDAKGVFAAKGRTTVLANKEGITDVDVVLNMENITAGALATDQSVGRELLETLANEKCNFWAEKGLADKGGRIGTIRKSEAPSTLLAWLVGNRPGIYAPTVFDGGSYQIALPPVIEEAEVLRKLAQP